MRTTNKLMILSTLLVSTVVLAFCFKNDLQAKTVKERHTQSTPRVLVAYFSRANHVPEGTDGVSGATNKAGNTQTVAAYISNKTGGDLFEIVPERDYPVSHSECSAIAQQEFRDNERPALRTHVENMDAYDVVYVGFPIWVYREPMAVLTFLEEYEFTGKTVVPFCTSMAVDITQSVEDFKRTLPGADVRDGLRLGYTLSGDWQAEVDRWIERLAINSSVSQETYKVNMTFGGQTLTATLEDNATTRAFIERLPLTLPMMDLYGREMCYRFPDALPTDNAVTQGYEIGEIVYYPPMHSFVILYAQNGERFQMQKLGRVDDGIELFEHIGNIDVRFELQSSPTGIAQIEENAVSVETDGHSITVKGKGLLKTTLYNADGKVLDKVNDYNRVELNDHDYNGLAIVEILDDNNNRTRKKVMIRN